jgi:hypothetical protein
MPESQPQPRTLDYSVERTATDLQIDFSPDGGVTITVPTRRSAKRFMLAAASADLRAIVFAPICWIVFMLFATCRPRAVLRLTKTDLAITETSDDRLGWNESRRSWRLAQIGELRRNRFEPGIYITIVGRDSFTLLGDIPESSIEAVSTALQEARKRVTGEAASDPQKTPDTSYSRTLHPES